MSGDRPSVHLTARTETVLARAIAALGRFPADQAWVLIGGVAVFVRLGSVTRPTADADTVARSQGELIKRLVADEVVTVVSGGRLQAPVGDTTVGIDVVDLADDPLPVDIERRAFALARRVALVTAIAEPIVVTDPDYLVTVAAATIHVATTAALVALKTVSMVRRPHGGQPQKVGSDIHDLVRLTTEAGARAVAAELVASNAELAGWVADQAERAFGADLRYTLLRLRTTDRSAAAQALTDDEIAATMILSDEVRDHLSG